MPSSTSGEIHRTATGLALLQGMAGERLKMVIQLMEKMGMGKLLQRFHQLNQQFITQERVVRILGKEGYEFPRVKPEEISHNYDFIPSGSSSLSSRELQLMQLIKFLEIGSQVPPTGGVQINLEEILKRIWEAMGFQKADDIIMKIAQPAIEQGQQAGQQAGAGLTPEQKMIKDMASQGAPVEAVLAKLQEMKGGQGGPSRGTTPQG